MCPPTAALDDFGPAQIALVYVNPALDGFAGLRDCRGQNAPEQTVSLPRPRTPLVAVEFVPGVLAVHFDQFPANDGIALARRLQGDSRIRAEIIQPAANGRGT